MAEMDDRIIVGGHCTTAPQLQIDLSFYHGPLAIKNVFIEGCANQLLIQLTIMVGIL